MKIQIKVPATSANLGPGFDCLGVALELYNEFKLEILKTKNEKLKIEVEGEGAEFIEKDEKNIVYKSIKKVCDICKRPIPKISLKIVSRIPVARGLGSSASARVAGVVLGNVLCGKKLFQDELINIATELEGHPDNVVPAMVGGLCVSRKFDHKVQKFTRAQVKYIKLTMPKDLVALILVPKICVSTEMARNVLPKVIDFKSATKNIGNVSMLISSIIKQKYDYIKFFMEDFLHQPFRKKLMPWMYDIFKICLENKSLGVALSGSGSSVFALYNKKELNTNIAEKIKKSVGKKINVEYKILNFVEDGVRESIEGGM